MDEWEAEEDMEKAGCGTRCNGWVEKDDALCQSKWSVGVNQIAAGLR